MAKARRKSTARHKPPENESKRDRFLRIATPRMQRALTAIRLLGNLSSPTYGWEKQDVEMIRSTLTQALNETMTRFDKSRKAEVAFEGFEKSLIEPA